MTDSIVDAHKLKILLIEDDIQLNTTMSNFLELIGYDVVALGDGDEALEMIDIMHFDLYIIDINIPNIGGLEILEYIRKKEMFVPIIIITASMELQNFQDAFNYGCNEYIKKPFFLEELEIRMNNLLSKEKSKSIQIDTHTHYDMKFEELHIDGCVVKLRKKERRLLTLLLQHCNHTVDLESIYAYVWENEIRESYPLRQLISEVRKYFPEKNYIVADVGIGYRFNI